MTEDPSALYTYPFLGLRKAPFLRSATCAALVLVTFLIPSQAVSVELSRLDRDNARMILKITREDLVKYYYDPAFHGLEMESIFATADAAITRAKTHAELFTAIAGPLMALDDSHTLLYSPCLGRED